MILLPKFKLTPMLVRLAYHFIDVEASADTALPDGRIIEYAFIIRKLHATPRGKVLDVGCTARFNCLPAALVSLGWDVWGIDTRDFKFKHPGFHFVLGDIRKTDLPDSFFDVVYAVSALEHIGLGGRYGVAKEDPQGDAKTVEEIARILRPGGILLCSVPFAREAKIIKPLARIYDRSSLHGLFHAWVVKEELWYHRVDGYWTPLPEEEIVKMENPDGESALALMELSPVK